MNEINDFRILLHSKATFASLVDNIFSGKMQTQNTQRGMYNERNCNRTAYKKV